jgi:DNA (cytosine-5)-methyltransferase 1
MTTFYNEWDKKTAAWLRELARQGHVTNGVVDERSITELRGEDLRGYGRVHLFAGIGGWDYALKLAGWPDDRPVWTGSCPCQPFSAAGKRKGQADERHLWPEMFRLIGECRPDTIFGEQVASAVGHGWLDGVFADLEGIGYTCGAVVLGAHSVGAPHMRQRLWWVADASKQPGERRARGLSPSQARINREDGSQHGHCVERLADGGKGRWLGITTSDGPQGIIEAGPACGAVERACADGGVEHVAGDGWEQGRAESDWWSIASGRSTLIPCGDGKTRRIEHGLSPLVDGVPARVVRLRGYGNAIVPQVAAAFVRAFMESEAS